MALLFTLVAGLLGSSTAAQAALHASLDRYRVAMGETVRLTISSDDNSDPGEADLDVLQGLFEVMERSSSVSTRIINGQRSQNRELLLELTPLREGSLVIPPFEVDGQKSEALPVEIVPEPSAATADDEVVTFEAEIDRPQVYVQGQLLLTLRVQQAVNLESRSITELELDNAYVETLGQNSFQRMIDGRPWLVHEIRYAIFPEASGELLIPVQTFSGRMGTGRRTLFDTRPAGRLIRRRSEELRIPVLPRPASYPDATWLPASKLAIEEQWSAPLDELKIGDSVTRTVTLTGDGLQGAQLPPVPTIDMDGLRAYPDQPGINNVTGDEGVVGIRSDSLALVAVTAGDYELPAIEIPWWDTQSDTLRIAKLPARRLRVLPPVPVAGAPGLPSGSPAASAPVLVGTASSGAGYWPWVSALCALGWLLTSVLWWRRRQPADARSAAANTARPSESPRALLAACRANDPRAAQRELRSWLWAQTSAYAGGAAAAGPARGKGHASGTASSVQDWLRQQHSPALSSAVNELERCLYQASDSSTWQGEALAAAIQTLGKDPSDSSSESSLPPLYLSQ